MAAILNLSQKRHLPLVDFGGLFPLDIWYPKEHVSSEMAFITFFSNQNLLFTGLKVIQQDEHLAFVCKQQKLIPLVHG